MARKTERYTVVTGASSGIGYETARAFAARGKNLIVAARRRHNLEALKSEILARYPTLDVVIKASDLSVTENVYRLYTDLKGYALETWINNAGFGHYGSAAHQDLHKIGAMLRLNVEAPTLFSSLFVSDYKDVEGTQLINISSAGGYTLVPGAVAYCATKFFVSAFTEGLARELKETGARMRAKVFAPAATQTEFGKVANDAAEYDYDKAFGTYHTSRQAAEFLLELYDSDKTVGAVDRETFEFTLHDPLLSYAGSSKHNQKTAAEADGQREEKSRCSRRE
ncbi:SDR family NAD(P)-dependent oxidoreductase [Fretibacterium sp. OH1220_COT-178]|uniref:SDR family NAD(P)-dependent oxidoreductase n=1 Tax=Fretibacterium sp. OH1220_COT-178 TaxID=2491047 RepID=UPI000F5DA116|nr:SDR family NAD(P)-dependent oxidoreductase [Fretibacterium sp. OH1220_COT-178]RRD64509.1 SDR family NAD(P)-dependent oxidoreductase [Fretibacterium sp. OH1220_COT-178]